MVSGNILKGSEQFLQLTLCEELQTKTCKVSLLSASKWSFFSANQPPAGMRQETVNGGIIRKELFFKESEQIRGSQRKAIVVENRYCMAPNLPKKISTGKFLPPITKCFSLFQRLMKIF